jgi:hypothetical protein
VKSIGGAHNSRDAHFEPATSAALSLRRVDGKLEAGDGNRRHVGD